MVEFKTGGRTIKGFIAEPSEEGKRPGLIIVHEWWGLNDHIKEIARRFAAEGYVALAPDLYDGKVAKDPGEAGHLMQALNQQDALNKLNAAVEYLSGRSDVDPNRIGVTGFCMGGTFALKLPCHNRKVKAAAPFYGDIPAETELQALEAPVLFIGAERDQWITKDKMERLREMMSRLGKPGEVKIYPGMDHAFFNDTRPEVYDKNAATDAWNSVLKFFAEKLQG
jgi:carboxymethylenebutenolidase